MQDTSNIQNWNALWGKDETRVEVRATIAGTVYDGYDGVSGVWEIKKTAPLLKTAEIGRCAAARLDLALVLPEGASIPRMAQIDLGVRLNDGTTQSGWLPKGTFFIDTRTQEDDVLKITAYDAMLKTEQSFTRSGDQGEWPRTDISVVNEIAQRIGVSVDARTTALMSRGYLVQYPGIVLEDGTPKYSADGGLTMREVLGYIGVMYGGNWCISDAGALRLVSFAIFPFINPLNTDDPALGEVVYFNAYPDIKWQVQHIDGNYVYLALYPMTERSTFGSDATYSGSTIASKCTTFMDNTIPNVTDYLEEVTVNGVTAKVFIPSKAMYEADWDWSKAGSSNRICQLNGSNMAYWTSSPYSSGGVWFVTDDGDFYDNSPYYSRGFRPAVKVKFKEDA